MKVKLCCLFFLLMVGFTVNAQLNSYHYKREIKDIKGIWNQIIIPPAVYSKVKDLNSELRIFGITPKQDTIEAPYLLKINEDKTEVTEIPFTRFNETSAGEQHFITFQIPTNQLINLIDLDFKNQNFDWEVRLEGRLLQGTWLTIIENYRILSIHNENTEYHFTTINFPPVHFEEYRLMIKSKEKPELESASIQLEKRIPGDYQEFAFKNKIISSKPDLHQTVLLLNNDLPVPVSLIKIFAAQKFDFSRPILIEYLKDSVKTPKGWIKQYEVFSTGTFNSTNNPQFHFTNVVTNEIKVTISNGNNTPLQIDSVTVSGNTSSLITRITEPAKYFIAYGKENGASVHYDIEEFINRIPDSLQIVSIGNEEIIVKAVGINDDALFKNKAWLWVLMGAIILVLGWFSLKMIKNI
ncbi:hypothetical protein BH11BAC2_BH11BAC2_02920 [soil metagenome]